MEASWQVDGRSFFNLTTNFCGSDPANPVYTFYSRRIRNTFAIFLRWFARRGVKPLEGHPIKCIASAEPRAQRGVFLYIKGPPHRLGAAVLIIIMLFYYVAS